MQVVGKNIFDRLQGGDGTQPPGVVLIALSSILSGLYGLGARTRRSLYNRGWLKAKRLPGPVLSVGNLTVGGTGKTPLTACLARLLQEQGYKIAILSRGYGGKAKSVTCISDCSRIYARPPEVGEEAYWLAQALPGAAVYTAPARYDAGLAAWLEIKPDLFLLDDGFQHFQLHRDLDVVLLDAAAPCGNGFLLPRGPLREPISTLAAADILILTRFKAHQHQDRLDLLTRKFPGKIVLTADIVPTSVRIFPEDREMALESLQDQSLLAFAGLARPRVFYDTLKNLNVELKGRHDFPDHYAFQPRDLENLIKKAQSLGAAGLITTAKDWARLGEKWEFHLPLWVLEVEARLEPGGEERILKILEKRDQRGNLSASSAKESLSPPSSPPYPALEPGEINHPIPLPPEAKQRLQQLQIKGRWQRDPAQVRRILVRAPNWVGDAVMSLPTLAGLHALFPRARVVLLAAPRVAPLFEGIPGVSQVVVYPPGLEKWRTLWRLRRGKTNGHSTENLSFDLGLALPNSWEAALGLWLAGAQTRVGYNTDARGPLLNLAVNGRGTLAGLHTVYYLLGVLQGLGEVESFFPPRLYLQAEEVEAAAALLGEAKGQGPWVGLSPGAAYGPAKRWPPERFAALGTELEKACGARLVLMGGPEDRDAAAAVTTKIPQALDLVGHTSLRQALGVLAQIQLLITNDSGLMHAAAALNTPLVALFGSTDPTATGPFTPKATVLHHPLPCSPCLKRTCDRDYQCLLDISVPEVLDAAKKWLKEGL